MLENSPVMPDCFALGALGAENEEEDELDEGVLSAGLGELEWLEELEGCSLGVGPND